MNLCPCGSNKQFNECCELYLSKKQNAPTAEATMRARYSAFVVGDIDYIKSTFNPSELDQFVEEDVKRWSSESTWDGLVVKNIELGQESDNNGVVEFIAKYSVGGVQQEHHEVAQFEKIDGLWYFMDGKVVGSAVKRTAPKVGRNEPCPCGSGKKYKKCCMK